MIWLLYLLLILGSIVGVVLVLLTMPGLWLVTAVAATYALVTRLHYLGVKSLIALLGLAVAGEIIETALMGMEARRSGGARGVTLGAFIGGIIGGIAGSFIPIPIVGTILGLGLGCFFGAAVMELKAGSGAKKVVQVGIGAARGRAYGILAKMIVGLVMLLVVLWAAFP